MLLGNPGRRKLNDAEPQPARGVPSCAPFLDDAAKQKWEEVVPELDRLGLLTIVDGDVLAAYCQAWAEFQWATETLRQEGRVSKRGTGALAPHPAVALQRSAWKAIRDFAALFGLDPSSRSRLHVAEPQKDSSVASRVRGA